MADTTIKLSGTYDSIEAYELLEEMRGVASDYLPLTGGEISGDLIVDGQLAGDLTGNVTGNVTGDVTGTASGNLPLSGGMLTGYLSFNASEGRIQNVNNDVSIGIYGGSGYLNGAYFTLNGKDKSQNGGAFGLYARDASGVYTLFGKPDGTLTWAGKSLITSDNITTQEKTGSAFSVNAGAVFSNASISVALSGYTPIGIVGWEISGSNASYANITKATLSGTTVYFSGRNTASSNVSWTPKATVLYIKN